MELFCKVLPVYFTINEGKKASVKDHFRGGIFFIFSENIIKTFFLSVKCTAGLCTIRLSIFIMNVKTVSFDFILSLKKTFQQQTSIVTFINTIYFLPRVDSFNFIVFLSHKETQLSTCPFAPLVFII